MKSSNKRNVFFFWEEQNQRTYGEVALFFLNETVLHSHKQTLGSQFIHSLHRRECSQSVTAIISEYRWTPSAFIDIAAIQNRDPDVFYDCRVRARKPMVQLSRSVSFHIRFYPSCLLPPFITKDARIFPIRARNSPFSIRYHAEILTFAE